jgi:hypothetical protein
MPEEPTQTMEVRPPGEEVTDFAVTLEKVRRLIFGVRCSDKRRRRLKEKCRQCDVDFRVPKGDAVGRWNTIYDMLSRLLSLRTPLHLLCFDDPRLMVSWPSPHEWDMITRFCDILQQYKAASLVMESESDVSITWAFPMMDGLMSAVESFQRAGIWGDQAVQQALQLSWESLRNYYRRMSQSVYYVCLFLNPQVKTAYVEKNWESDWLPAAEDALQRAWASYKNVALPHESRGPAPPPHPDQRRAIPLNPFKHEVEQQAQAVLPTDELEQYKMMSPMAEDVWADRYESNALIWWAESGCRLFPRLALMAKDYFSAQGQSHSTAVSHLSNIGILKRRRHQLNEPFRPPEMRRARIRNKCPRRRYRRL